MKQALTGIALGVWAIATVGVVGALMVNHTVSMPAPWRDSVEHKAAQTFGASPGVLHVIYAGCSCTNGLVDHLLDQPDSPVNQHVIFVGEPRPRHLPLWDRFPVEQASQAYASTELGVPAAPVFGVWNGTELRYLGGYFALPAAIHALHEDIVLRSLEGQGVEPLPVFGCAVDPALSAQLDPLGLQR